MYVNKTNQDSALLGNNNLSGPISGSGWSVQNAALWTGLLPDARGPGGTARNDQRQALRDFLALYAVTRSDNVTGNGTWDDLASLVMNAGAQTALFGNGSNAIWRVFIGGENGANDYAAMHSVLDALQINKAAKDGHHTHFHIDLRTPDLVRIDRNLLTDAPILDQPHTLAAEDLRAAAQALLDEVQPGSVFEEGEVTMFAIGMPPDIPPQYAPIVITQASKAQAGDTKTDRTIGVCHLIENDPESRLSAVNSLEPIGETWIYLTRQEKRSIDEATFKAAKATLLQAPVHGTLEIDDTGGAAYFPTSPDYRGPDRATVLVEMGGFKVKVVYFFNVMESVPGGSDQGDPHNDPAYCPQGKGRVWKISFNPADPTADVLIAGDPIQLTSTLGALPTANLAFSDLPGTAVGQTTANTITLDLDAAGHGWFIDSTPYDNSEFLPTSDPNVWVAKPGSAAEGKMDMLTVLLHEYGHVLGLDHSADANDLMGANLQPGVRHTIGAEVYEQIWSLAGDSGPFDLRAPLPPSLPLGLPLLFGLGRMRLQGGSEPKGASLPPLEADPNAFEATPTPIYRMQPMYETALHTGIYNGAFDLTDPLNSQFGWNTRGEVSLAGGEAVISEDDRLISGLTQTFVMPEGIVGLGFTISGAQFAQFGIGDPSAPSDAFEVAVLDATTGLSVAGTAPLSGTDAILNIQGDGTAFGAGSVTVRRQPITAGSVLSFDDPIRVTVDLSTVTAGTTLKLYLDLLGMGAANSSIRVDDVRLLTNFNTEPVAVDDAISTAEDTALMIPVLANDQDPEGDLLAVTLVAGPLHGTLGQNPDGSFAYTPEANYTGTDN